MRFFLLFSLLSLIMAAALTATDIAGTRDRSDPASADCIRCHQKMVTSVRQRAYVHTPFLQGRCVFCHLDNGERLPGADPASARPTPRDEKRSPAPGKERPRWLFRDFHATATHWFLVPADQVDDTIYLQLTGDRGRPVRTAITVPPSTRIRAAVNDRTGPKISQVRLLGFRRGVFLSAVITWRTDTPATAQVLYGLKRVEENRTPATTNPSTEHRLILSPILPGKTYQYRLVCRDVFGNISRSDILSFSSDPPRPVLDREPAVAAPSPQPVLRHSLLKVGDRYLLEVHTGRPLYMAVGVRRHLRRARPVTTRTAAGREPGFRHPRLRSKAEVSLKICRACHASYWQGATHPVNVRPRRGMVIPPRYPVLDDGRITCISCHAAHGSNYEARMRRSSKEALCIGCHTEYK